MDIELNSITYELRRIANALEASGNTATERAFDEMMGDPMSAIDRLVKQRDHLQARVDYLEAECDRISDDARAVLAANVRLVNERNKQSVGNMEGVD